LYIAAQSIGAGIPAEVTMDGGSTTQSVDATDEYYNSSRRHKQCKQRVDLASLMSTGIPASLCKPTNPYSLYFMLRKKVQFSFT